MTKVSAVMTRNPSVIEADENLLRAARMLAEHDVGALPVAQGDRLVGMLTDRDIVVRAVAGAQDPATTQVQDVLSAGVKYCFEDEDVVRVAASMDELLVRRLPVLNRDKRLVGMVSLDDLRPRRH